MQRDINAEGNQALADAIELVLSRYGICGHGHARWALLVYPDESEPQEVNLISNGKSAQIEHVLLAARELMLGADRFIQRPTLRPRRA